MTYRKQIIPEAPQSFEDKLVREHGELVNRKDAGKIINRTDDTIKKYVDSGFFRTAPNGDVIVRSLAQWIYGNPREMKNPKIVVLP